MQFKCNYYTPFTHLLEQICYKSVIVNAIKIYLLRLLYEGEKMKVYKMMHKGTLKYCAFIDTGEKYSSGRPKEKRFFALKRFDAVAKAEAFQLRLKTHLPAKDEKPSTGETLGFVYSKLQKHWDAKVKLRERNPKKKKTITDDTRNRYEEYANALFKVVDKNIQVSKISKLFVADLIDQLNDLKTESQAYRTYSVFNMIMLHAEKLDYINISPTHAFKEDRPTYDSDGERTIDDKEMKALYKQILWSYMKYKSQSALILLIEANTGARWGEVAALHHADFDFKNNIITIKKSKSCKTGKIGLTKSANLRSDKNDKGERYLPIDPRFAEIIKDYIANCQVKDGYLFDCSYTVTQDTLIAAGKRAGSDARETKTFRRWISSKVENDLKGKQEKDVELLLGHKNSSTKNKYITYNFKNANKIAKLVHSSLN